ncbi:MAG: sirohydrochlorin cobaltochelatase [Desulfococcus multivorans]|jgi:sirohydrochlorin cobaltochelatase|uniref:sirohydrochlorin cobaltochelatase n=1 Tax=Desulfococcus sp. TaxID=2025834 RepID=UPI002A3809C8|nr:sirohydrochlorin cobaltochelatase [Desulfococcus multivorans]
MKTPIVLAAFGTTTRAMKTYSFINDICRERFIGHPIFWAFSSRQVRDFSNRNYNTNMQHPHEVLRKLKKEGYPWAVVQSLHFTCGHEFYRLIEEVGDCGIRTAMGLPLLHRPEDYKSVVAALMPHLPEAADEAMVMIGHGTDHPSWSSYVALDYIFRKTKSSGVYVGLVEQGYPTMASVIEEVSRDGYRKVKLVPLMLVAGLHFEEDMSGDNHSWRFAFENAGIAVSLENQGLGFNRGIVDLYCRHIHDALDVIPDNQGCRLPCSKIFVV